MNSTIEVPALDILIGDKIEFNHQVWTVMFVALVRGMIIEITVKPIGLQARMAPERKLIVHKNAPVNKVI
jgi:hypothetical protein